MGSLRRPGVDRHDPPRPRPWHQLDRHRAHIRAECEASLRRLGVEVIDLYQIHWPNPEGEIEAAWTTMAELQQEGKVRHLGVSNFSVAQLERLQPIAPVASLQPPYSLLRREIEVELLPFCAEQQIGVIVYSPMMSGLLSGTMTHERIAAMPDDDWRRRDVEYEEPRLSRTLALVELLREIGAHHGRSPGEVAIAWTLRTPLVTGAIVGARRPDQEEPRAPEVMRLSSPELSRPRGGWLRVFLTGLGLFAVATVVMMLTGNPNL